MPPSFVITPVIPDFSELTAQCARPETKGCLCCVTDSTVLCRVCTTTTTHFISPALRIWISTSVTFTLLLFAATLHPRLDFVYMLQNRHTPSQTGNMYSSPVMLQTFLHRQRRSSWLKIIWQHCHCSPAGSSVPSPAARTRWDYPSVLLSLRETHDCPSSLQQPVGV